MREEGIEEAREFATRILERYGDLVKSVVVVGSVVRGESGPRSDVDVFVVLDDTLQGITEERQEELNEEMRKIAESVSGNLDVMPPFTLSEFTDYARTGHPVVYNLIKEGVPVYDTGFFMPWKRLLLAGRIPRTREAIDRLMEDASRKILRARSVKLLVLAEDCYYAILDSAQAVLMAMGLEPPVPGKAYEEVLRHLVDPGILEKEYADWLREIVDIRKRIQHKELLDAPGTMVDEWLDRAERFVRKMSEILGSLELTKEVGVLRRTYEVMRGAAALALKELHNIPEEASIAEVEAMLGMSLSEAFKREFIDSGKIKSSHWDLWRRVEDLKRGVVDERKLDKLKLEEVYELRERVRKLIFDLEKILVRKNLPEEP